jgi:8-oxo-dGTP diphosphatase
MEHWLTMTWYEGNLYRMECITLQAKFWSNILMVTNGGYYEATAGGSALKGEDKISCAKRELLEETGISSNNLQEIGHYTSHDTIYYNFLCVTDCDKSSITLQKGETISYKWISESDFIAFVNSNEMIDIQRMRYRNFFIKMGYIK